MTDKEDEDSIWDSSESETNWPTLALNPRGEDLDDNPLCPVCEEQIVPITSQTERRFKCGCNQDWKYTFDKGVSSDSESDGCSHQDLNYGDHSEYRGDGVWVFIVDCEDCEDTLTVKRETEVVEV